MARPPSGPRRLTPTTQKALLLRQYPGGHVVIDGERLVWLGRLTPTEYSATYEVLIDHQSGAQPLIYVVRPRLRLFNDEPLPHVYSWNTLCLYLDKHEWNRSMPIANTIVPWASEWLFFYELWLTTGEWLGDGVHPDSGATNRAARRSWEREKEAKLRRLRSALRLIYGRDAYDDSLLENARLRPPRTAAA